MEKDKMNDPKNEKQDKIKDLEDQKASRHEATPEELGTDFYDYGIGGPGAGREDSNASSADETSKNED